MNSIQILHISDMYLGEDSDATRVLMRQLCAAIQEATYEQDVPIVLLSGDLVASGKEREYELVEEFLLEPLRQFASTRNSIVVSAPGNFDLDCDEGLPINWNALGAERQRGLFQDDERGRKIRASRARAFEQYSNFLARNNIVGVDPLQSMAAGEVIETPNGAIYLATMVTSLFSDREVSDYKKSVAPVPALEGLSTYTKTAAIKIALGHHPIEWFTQESAKQLSDYLESRDFIYIHGQSNGPKVGKIAGEIRSIGIGLDNDLTSSNEEAINKEAPTYNFGLYRFNSGAAVEFRRWNASSSVWDRIENNGGTGQDPNGFYPIGPDHTPTDEQGRSASALASGVKTKVSFASAIWLSQSTHNRWITLLQDLHELETGKLKPVFMPQKLSAGHEQIRLNSSRGEFLIHAVKSRGDILTSEQLQTINTEFDRQGYSGALVITLGRLDDAAKTLASQLSARKEFTVISYHEICTRIANRFGRELHRLLSAASSSGCEIALIIADQEYFILIKESKPGERFVVLKEDGTIVAETAVIVRALKEENHLKPSSLYQEAFLQNLNVDDLPRQSEEFDETVYKQRTHSHFNDVKYAPLAALGFKFENATLEDVYINTSASLSDDGRSSYQLSRLIDEIVENLDVPKAQRDQLEGQLRAKVGLEGPPESGMARQFYQKYNNIVVLGDPGSGKTCFVKHELLAYCDLDHKSGDWYADHLPIFLSLAEAANLINSDASILDACVTAAGRRGISLPRKEIEEYLANGRAAFFFDGLDEVGSIEKRIDLMEQIGRLTEYAARGNRFVLTSRPAAIQPVDIPEQLLFLQLNGLSEAEMRRLALSVITLRFSDGERAKGTSSDDQRVIDRLIDDTRNSRGIARLASNPLLLTLLVLIYANAGAALSARRHLVYSHAIKTLVSVRGKDTRAQKISEADLRIRLGAIAIAIFSRAIQELPERSEVQRTLEPIMSSSGALDRGQASLEVANGFIQEVAEATGLLNIHRQVVGVPEKDLITFMHYSFLEYYAAAGLISQGSLGNIGNLATNPRWKDVITLLFGIMSEQADVSPAFQEILHCSDDKSSESITIFRLLLAIECASECDVAPEQTQRILAHALFESLTSGASRYSAAAREELANCLNNFLPNAGEAINSFFIDGLRHEDPMVAAATCDLIARLSTDYELNAEIIRAFDALISKDHSVLRSSILFLVEQRQEFRNEATTKLLIRALKGNVTEKHAALKAIGKAVNYYYESAKDSLIALLDDKNPMISQFAGQCLLATPLMQTTTLRRAARDKVLAALNTGEYDEGRALGVYIERSAVERLLRSEESGDIELGLRYMQLLEDEDKFIAETVLKLVEAHPQNDRIIAAGLQALRRCDGALKHVRWSHSDKICRFRLFPKRNVRVAAIRLLGALSVDSEIIKNLKQHIEDSARMRERSDELKEAANALSIHAKRDAELRRLIVALTIEKLPSNNENFGSEGKQQHLSGLLSICETIAEPFPEKDARRLLSMAEDYRTPSSLQKQAMRAYGRVGEPSPSMVDNLVRLLKGKNRKMHPYIYQAVRSMLGQASKKVEYARAIYWKLPPLREALIQSWQRETLISSDSIEMATLREIRFALKEVEYLVTSYQEFSTRRDNAPERENEL
jgi:hypothetical protein